MNNKNYILLFLFIILFIVSCEHKPQSNNYVSHNQQSYTQKQQPVRINNMHGKTVVKMESESGVYKVPCLINGTQMNFIFDTGASSITMSLTEALFLYKQGLLTDDDFIGTEQYQIANGSVEEGTIVNLKTVEIGNRTLHNVQASIVHNLQAPLLLGQSALSQFGKISIDYTKNEITFE